MNLKNILIALLLFTSLKFTQAQKTTVFNGKTYLVYPQTIDAGYYTNSPSIEITEKILQLNNIMLPPILGSVADGEYIIYKNDYKYIKKGKGKRATYDTLPKEYGTFTIKDNLKNGKAIIFNSLALGKNTLLNYKNDLLEGVHYFELNNYSRVRYDYSKNWLKISKYIEEFAKINLSNGIANGELIQYLKIKLDTLIVIKANAVNGELNGKYTENEYEFDKKGKGNIKNKTEGELKNGWRIGTWLYYDQNYFTKTFELFEEKAYNEKSKITETRNYVTNNSISYRYTYNKDSVLKYFPNYKKEKTMLFTYGHPKIRKDSFVLITKYFPKVIRAFKAYNKISSNYYLKINDDRIYDTIINGILFRVEGGFEKYKKKYYAIKEFRIIDTLSSKDEENGYSSDVIFTLYYNDENEMFKTEYSDLYKNYFFKDSLLPELKSTYQNKHITLSNYYHKALDYTFANVKYRKGRLKNCEIYYKVNGGKNTGSIIKYLKIPCEYDTIYLIDTLMYNGKYLYTLDNQFNTAYNNLKFKRKYDRTYAEEFNEKDLSKYNDVLINEEFIEEIYEFTEPLPIQHKTLMLGKSLYKGDLDLEIDYCKKPSKFKAGVFEYTENMLDLFEKRLSIDINIQRNINTLKGSYNSDFVMPYITKTQNYFKGILGGNLFFKDFYNNSFNIYVYNNKISSTFSPILYQFKNSKYRSSVSAPDFLTENISCGYRGPSYKSITLKNALEIKGSVMQYVNGQKYGQWCMYDNGRILRTYNYHNGSQNGLQLNFNARDDNYINYVYTMQNDTVNGKVFQLYKNGLPETIGEFKQGVPNGFFTQYMVGIDTSKYFYKRFQFDNGFLIGNYFEYRNSNNLKVKISFNKADSLIYDGHGNPIFNTNNLKTLRFKFNKDLRFENYQIESIPFNFNKYVIPITGIDFIANMFNQSTFKKAYYQYYYTSGTIFKQGKKEYEQPIGEWQVYREGNNRLYKTIYFKDSTLFATTPDSIQTYGLVNAYYDNGKLMFTGYATDFNFKYSCESDADMPTENDYYLQFYDTTGKPMLSNGNGFITELQANGNKLKEGKINSNKKEGIWIYYSKFGLPDEIGNYTEGLKTGRWLVGDLGGLNLDEKVCFMNDEEFKNWVKMFGGNLNLKEEFYNNGLLVTSNYVNTIKR